MNVSRITRAMIIALGVSGLFTFWLSRRVVKANHPRVAPRLQYVAAAKPLEAGEVLKTSKLQTIDWGASVPLTGGFSKREDLAGRVVLYPLAKGEPIVDRQLAAPGAQAGLTANIPSGMRAISVRSDEVVGVAGFLLPGTHVDVLVTYRPEDSSALETVTVLQDVEILAAGQQMHPDPDGKPVSVNVVTLLLKPEDGERVVLATSLGAIHFVLRNGLDRGHEVSFPVGFEQLTGAASAAKKQRTAFSTEHSRTKPPRYVIETILGDKQVLNSFN